MVSQLRLGFGRIPSPLEVADAVLDSVAEVVEFPARAGTNVASAAQQTFSGVKSAIDQPKNAAGIPAPPDVIVGGALNGVSAIGQGVVAGVTGVVQAAAETGNGVKGQIDALIRR